MDFTAIEQAWTDPPSNGETGGPSVDRLLEKTLQASRLLSRKVWRRDLVEGATTTIVAICLVWMATRMRTPWPWVVAAGLNLVVGARFVIERVHGRRRPTHARDVRAELQQALCDVEHQMTLLGGVARWYLAPLGLAALLVVGGAGWDASRSVSSERWALAGGWIELAMAATFVVTIALFWMLWRVNLRTVRRDLEPQRETIESVLKQLEA